MSALDRLVSQDDDDEYDDSEGSEAESDGEEEESEEEEEDEEEEQEYEEFEANKKFYKFINGREKKDMSSEEWDLVVRQYYRQPTTDLERSVILNLIFCHCII